MLLLMYAGVLNGLVFKHLLVGKYFGMFITVFITSLAYYFLEYSMSFMIWGQGNFAYAFWRVMLVAAVYNAVICVPIYMLARKGYRRYV
jgi:hypothetical protein